MAPEPEDAEETFASAAVPDVPTEPSLPEPAVAPSIEEKAEEVTPAAPEPPIVQPSPPASDSVAPAAPPAPPAPPTAAAAPVVYVTKPKPTITADGQPISSRSRLIAVLLCFFLGAIGVHSFYAGKNTNGIIQIVITVVTLGTLGWVWPLIDFIMLLMGSYKDDEDKLILNWET